VDRVLEIAHRSRRPALGQGQEQVPLVDHAVDLVEVSFRGHQDAAVELQDVFGLELGERLLRGQKRRA